MALIPTDVGINLRTQVDSPLRPTAPAREIPSDLPDLRQGQVFSARILEVLPEQTYKALVAGKTITLSLPSSAKSGDSLELVVVDKTPQSITARLAADSALAGELGGQPYPHATLSPAAQLIARLLPNEGEKPVPVTLNQGEPILSAPPDTDHLDPATIAQQLGKAVAQSGMFYEAHQAKWVAGRLPTDELLAEPQNQASHPAHAEAAVQGSATKSQGLLGWLGGEKTSAPTTDNAGMRTPMSNQHAIPEELRNIVQQQLDAAATQRVLWHGEVWPNQPMEWEIQRDAPERSAVGEEPNDQWTTRLVLTTPRLGRVEATLQLRSTGVHISILAPGNTSVEELRQSLPQLGNSLEAAGVPPLSLLVKKAD